VADRNEDVVRTMGKNLSSTRVVIEQLPESWKSDDDVNSYARSIEVLEERWANLKAKLASLLGETTNKMDNLEKGKMPFRKCVYTRLTNYGPL